MTKDERAGQYVAKSDFDRLAHMVERLHSTVLQSPMQKGSSELSQLVSRVDALPANIPDMISREKYEREEADQNIHGVCKSIQQSLSDISLKCNSEVLKLREKVASHSEKYDEDLSGMKRINSDLSSIDDKLRSAAAVLGNKMADIEGSMALSVQSSSEGCKEAVKILLSEQLKSFEDVSKLSEIVKDIQSSRSFDFLVEDFKRLRSTYAKFQADMHMEISKVLEGEAKETAKTRSQIETVRENGKNLKIEFDGKLAKFEEDLGRTLNTSKVRIDQISEKLSERLNECGSRIEKQQSETLKLVEGLRSEYRSFQQTTNEANKSLLAEIKVTDGKIKQATQETLKILQQQVSQVESDFKGIVKSTENFLVDQERQDISKIGEAISRFENKTSLEFASLESRIVKHVSEDLLGVASKLAGLNEFCEITRDACMQSINEVKNFSSEEVREVRRLCGEISMNTVSMSEKTDKKLRDLNSLVEEKTQEIFRKFPEISGKFMDEIGNQRKESERIIRQEIMEQCERISGETQRGDKFTASELGESLRGATEAIAERIALVDVQLREITDRLSTRLLYLETPVIGSNRQHLVENYAGNLSITSPIESRAKNSDEIINKKASEVQSNGGGDEKKIQVGNDFLGGESEFSRLDKIPGHVIENISLSNESNQPAIAKTITETIPTSADAPSPSITTVADEKLFRFPEEKKASENETPVVQPQIAPSQTPHVDESVENVKVQEMKPVESGIAKVPVIDDTHKLIESTEVSKEAEKVVLTIGEVIQPSVLPSESASAAAVLANPDKPSENGTLPPMLEQQGTKPVEEVKAMTPIETAVPLSDAPVNVVAADPSSNEPSRVPFESSSEVKKEIDERNVGIYLVPD